MPTTFAQRLRSLIGIDPKKDPEGFNRRAFLLGGMVTSAGLIVPKPKMIQVPRIQVLSAVADIRVYERALSQSQLEYLHQMKGQDYIGHSWYLAG